MGFDIKSNDDLTVLYFISIMMCFVLEIRQNIRAAAEFGMENMYGHILFVNPILHVRGFSEPPLIDDLS